MNFQCGDSLTLEIDSVFARVTIVRGDTSGTVEISLAGADEDCRAVRIAQRGDTISLTGSEESGTVIIGGNTEVVFSNINFAAGDLVVGSSPTAVSRHLPVDISVAVPSDVEVELMVRRAKSVDAHIPLSEVRIDAAGQSTQRYAKVGGLRGSASGQHSIYAASVDKEMVLRLSGQGTLEVAEAEEARVVIECSGQWQADLTGSFKDVAVDASGMCHLKSNGRVSANFGATVTGMSSVKHRGAVHGRTSRHTSGMSSVEVLD